MWVCCPLPLCLSVYSFVCVCLSPLTVLTLCLSTAGLWRWSPHRRRFSGRQFRAGTPFGEDRGHRRLQTTFLPVSICACVLYFQYARRKALHNVWLQGCAWKGRDAMRTLCLAQCLCLEWVSLCFLITVVTWEKANWMEKEWHLVTV